LSAGHRENRGRFCGKSIRTSVDIPPFPALIEDLDGIGAAYRPIDPLIRQRILAFSINFSDCGSITAYPEVIPKKCGSVQIADDSVVALPCTVADA
jgi:hypothetical protein